MINQNLPIFNPGLCTGCNRCVLDCPRKIISLDGNRKAYLLTEDCIECSHCYAVCPEGAVSFNNLKGPVFSSFSYNEELIQPGGSDPSGFMNLVRSRKSTRQYTSKPVSRRILEDLVQGAIQAPSGSNNQDWKFTILDNREKVWDLAGFIRDYFARLNQLAANPLVRFFSKFFIGNKLVNYHNEYSETIQWAIDQAEKGMDLLFHGAPAVMIFHAPFAGSTPREDSQFASYNAALLAHTLGLGTCYIGFAVEALNRMPATKAKLGIPGNHRVNAVLTVGFPKVTYERAGLRKPVDINRVDL